MQPSITLRIAMLTSSQRFTSAEIQRDLNGFWKESLQNASFLQVVSEAGLVPSSLPRDCPYLIELQPGAEHVGGALAWAFEIAIAGTTLLGLVLVASAPSGTRTADPKLLEQALRHLWANWFYPQLRTKYPFEQLNS
jgi:hypothetical protein